MSNELLKSKITELVKSGDLVTDNDIREFIASYRKSDKRVISTFQSTKGIMNNLKFNEGMNITSDTPIEQLIEGQLKLANISYKAQHSIGKYIIDFFIEPNICVECDGRGFHNSEAQVRKGKARDSFLFSRGYMVRHFTGSEIYSNPGKCISEIKSLML